MQKQLKLTRRNQKLGTLCNDPIKVYDKAIEIILYNSIALYNKVVNLNKLKKFDL